MRQSDNPDECRLKETEMKWIHRVQGKPEFYKKLNTSCEHEMIERWKQDYDKHLNSKKYIQRVRKMIVPSPMLRQLMVTFE